MQPFVHLHVHSQYSLLDGQASIARLVDKAMKDGMKALALTDHGVMYGVKDFVNYISKKNAPVKAKIKKIENELKALQGKSSAEDIVALELELKNKLELEQKNLFKPIIGCEFYTGNTEKLKGYHLIVLAKNQTGLQNLFKLQKLSYMDNFYGKPKITKRMLFTYAEGLIVTTACIGSEFGSLFFDNNINILKETLASYKHIFGDDFYIEIQPNNIPEQKDYNIKMLELANQLSVKCIVSCDAHYVNKED